MNLGRFSIATIAGMALAVVLSLSTCDYSRADARSDAYATITMDDLSSAEGWSYTWYYDSTDSSGDDDTGASIEAKIANAVTTGHSPVTKYGFSRWNLQVTAPAVFAWDLNMTIHMHSDAYCDHWYEDAMGVATVEQDGGFLKTYEDHDASVPTDPDELLEDHGSGTWSVANGTSSFTVTLAISSQASLTGF